MRSNIPKPLADQLERLDLVPADVLPRASSWVAKWGGDLPPLEALWIDALQRTGAITAFQAVMLQCGLGPALRIGPYVLISELGRLNGRPRFLARRIDQPGDYELIVIECSDRRQAERLSNSAAVLAEAGCRWRREHTWPAVDLVAPVIDVGADECRFYAALEHFEGRSLAELITSRGSFAGGLASVVARPLLLLLAEVEEAKVGCEIITLEHVRFTRQGGVVLIAPGLLDLLSSEEPSLPAAADRAPGDSRTDGSRSAHREAPAKRGDSNVNVRRKACGALLKQLICGTANRGTARWNSSSSASAPALTEVIDRLMSPSSDSSFRELADRLPRCDEASRRSAARQAYRPIAIERQWLQSCGHGNQGLPDLSRVMKPLLWSSVIGGLLIAGWWMASLRSSILHRDSLSTCAAAATSSAGICAAADAAPNPSADATESNLATNSTVGEQKPGSFSNFSRSAQPRAFAERTTGEGVFGGDSQATVKGGRRDSIVRGAEGSPRSGGMHQGGRAESHVPTDVRPVQFEEDRESGASGAQRGRTALSRPADLIIDAQTPMSADRLRVRDGQRVRAASGRRATIVVPDGGWRLSADGVVFEHIDFAFSRLPKSDQDDEMAMIVFEGRQAEFCGCTFDGSGRTAIDWETTARASEQRLVLGRLLLLDCVFRDCRAAVQSEGQAAQVVEAANVLHWRGNAFWRIETPAGGEPLKLSLRQFTSRDSGPLIEFASEPSAAVSLTVEADSAVIAPRAGLPVLMLHGERPDWILDRLSWSGRGAILAGESPFAALTRGADEVIALGDESAAVAGLTRGRIVFAGSVESGIEGQQVAQWQGPSSDEDPPGIAARRLPQPTARR